MCGGKKPKSVPMPKPAPVAAPIISTIEADETVKKAGDEERKRRKAAYGRSDTILTGGTGVAGLAQTTGKQLLGQ